VKHSKQEKDEETGSFRKAKGKKVKAPIEDLDAETPKFHDNTCESPKIRLTDKERGLVEGSDSNHDSEVNIKYGGHNRRDTVTLRDTGVSLGDDFFDVVETSSNELANLDEVIFLFFIMSSNLDFPFGKYEMMLCLFCF